MTHCPAIIGRTTDDSHDARADTVHVSKFVRSYCGGSIGKLCIDLFRSKDNEDRGGVVLRISVKDSSSSFLPLSLDICDGIEIHMAGDLESEALLNALQDMSNFSKRIRIDGKNTYTDFGEMVGALVDEKNAAYGSSFAKAHEILRVLYPNGVQPEQYTDMLGVIRVIDKLFRIATAKDALGENPWQDIAGYGLLGMKRDG